MSARHNNDLFAEHASPESIRAELEIARKNRDRWQRRIDWLSRLRDDRDKQIEAGTWPTA